MSTCTSPLPPLSLNQPFYTVSAIEAGTFTVPTRAFVSNAPPGETRTIPSLSFFLRHSSTGKTFLVDLGVPKGGLDSPCIAPKMREMTRQQGTEVIVKRDVAESLAMEGVKPEDIDYVILTHCHFDHTGDTHLFTKAQFIVGAETPMLVSPGYPQDPDSICKSDLLPSNRTLYLPPTSSDPSAHNGKWTSIGPFPHAYDYFADGSLYIIDAPGHCPGHIMILARTSPTGGWICLAGDSAHDWRLLRGKSEIAVLRDEHGNVKYCVHQDIEKAKLTIERVGKLIEGDERVRVIIAHDFEFWEANKDGEAFWPGKIPSL